ncbi:TPA: hypothetical protein F3L05_09645 [Aeromonas hydrophila]|nr:hypothetical protein [Aeromonas hydrophila]
MANLAARLFASAQFLPHFLAKIWLQTCKVVQAVVVDIKRSIKYPITDIFKRLVMWPGRRSALRGSGATTDGANRRYFQGGKEGVDGLLPPHARPAGSKI